MDTFPKKGLYHSDLTRETETGALTVKLKGDPRKSKYEGKPDYVYFTVRGDEREYSYNVENEECAQQIIAAPKGVWLEMVAAGSRDVASLQFKPSDVVDSDPAPWDNPAPAESVSGTASPAVVEEAKAMSGLARNYFAALEASRQALEGYHAAHGSYPADDVVRIATTIYISNK